MQGLDVAFRLTNSHFQVVCSRVFSGFDPLLAFVGLCEYDLCSKYNPQVLSHRWNRNPRPQAETFSKLVSLITTSLSYRFLNWLSGVPTDIILLFIIIIIISSSSSGSSSSVRQVVQPAGAERGPAARLGDQRRRLAIYKCLYLSLYICVYIHISVYVYISM